MAETKDAVVAKAAELKNSPLPEEGKEKSLLGAGGIFLRQEVEQFCDAFFTKNKSNAATSNICKPAVQR